MVRMIANRPISSLLAVRLLLLLLLLHLAPIGADEGVTAAVNLLRSKASPTASNMRYMEWSPDYAAQAEQLAKKCDFAAAAPKPGVVFSNFSHAIETYDALIRIAVEGERAISDGRCKPEATHLSCRFYRDLMEADADRIGFARVLCPNREWHYYYVSNARSSNEPFTDLAYEKGAPCQKCPASSGYCYHNLCVSQATKTAIKARIPSSVFSCDAPCLNCGVRTDVDGSCFCQCPEGYNSEADCSKGSGRLTCSACRLAGTPCRNGGREAGHPSGGCRCLCNGDYGGEFCEIPMAQIVGGVVVRIRRADLTMEIVDSMADKLKRILVDEINLFCHKSQANYLQCCGSGTLPSSGALDFVDSVSVHVASLVITGAYLINEAAATVHATAKGNNTLCRKRTSSPVPILAVPPTVVRRVIEDKLVGKDRSELFYIRFESVTNSYADHYNVSVPTMSFLSVKVG